MATITERLEAATASHELAAQRMHDLLDAIGPISGSDVYSVDITNAASVAALGALFNFRPEIETPTQALAVTNNGNGTVTVNAGQSWVWRGFRRFTTDDIDAVDRTFATAASKTHHLRWSPVDGLALKDVADAAYNPGALAEADTAFDTVLDDMLVARIVTDAVNTPTTTILRNAARLTDRIYDASAVTYPNANSSHKRVDQTINWAVSPSNWAIEVAWTNINNSSPDEFDVNHTLEVVDRYHVRLFSQHDYAVTINTFTDLQA